MSTSVEVGSALLFYFYFSTSSTRVEVGRGNHAEHTSLEPICKRFLPILMLMMRKIRGNVIVALKKSFRVRTNNKDFTASGNIRKPFIGGKRWVKQSHCLNNNQCAPPTHSKWTAWRPQVWTQIVISHWERVVERKVPMLKYGKTVLASSQKFPKLWMVGRIMPVVTCSTMWDRPPHSISRMCASLQIPTIWVCCALIQVYNIFLALVWYSWKFFRRESVFHSTSLSLQLNLKLHKTVTGTKPKVHV